MSDADVSDLAAYLGRVLPVSNDQANIALYPATVEFGTLTLGQVSPEHQITLVNRSLTTQAIGDLRVRGIDARLRHNCPSSLPAGDRCEAWVQFAADGVGKWGGALTLSVPSLGSPLQVGLAVEVRMGPVGVLSTELIREVGFGNVTAGGRSDVSMRLRSHGDVPVTLGVTALTGPDRARFSVEGNCADGLVLPPGTFCTMGLSYRPAVAGSARAGLQWRSDGLNPGNLILAGSAIAASAPTSPTAPAPGPPSTSTPSPTTPSPLPAPALSSDGSVGGGGGGCSMASPHDKLQLPAGRPVDPVLLVLVFLSVLRLSGRKRVHS